MMRILGRLPSFITKRGYGTGKPDSLESFMANLKFDRKEVRGEDSDHPENETIDSWCLIPSETMKTVITESNSSIAAQVPKTIVDKLSSGQEDLLSKSLAATTIGRTTSDLDVHSERLYLLSHYFRNKIYPKDHYLLVVSKLLESFTLVCGISAQDFNNTKSPAYQVFSALLDKRLITPKTLETLVSTLILDNNSQSNDIRLFLSQPALLAQGLLLKNSNWENVIYACLAAKNYPSIMKGFDTMIKFIGIDEFAVLYCRMCEKGLHNNVITEKDFGFFSKELVVSGIFAKLMVKTKVSMCTRFIAYNQSSFAGYFLREHQYKRHRFSSAFYFSRIQLLDAAMKGNDQKGVFQTRLEETRKNLSLYNDFLAKSGNPLISEQDVVLYILSSLLRCLGGKERDMRILEFSRQQGILGSSVLLKTILAVTPFENKGSWISSQYVHMVRKTLSRRDANERPISSLIALASRHMYQNSSFMTLLHTVNEFSVTLSSGVVKDIVAYCKPCGSMDLARAMAVVPLQYHYNTNNNKQQIPPPSIDTGLELSDLSRLIF